MIAWLYVYIYICVYIYIYIYILLMEPESNLVGVRTGEKAETCNDKPFR